MGRGLAAERRQLAADAARDNRARGLVQAWEGLIHDHHAALPVLGTDPTPAQGQPVCPLA